jgi:hypothetical protein
MRYNRDLSDKQKALFRMRRYARRAALARLGGYIMKANEWDNKIEHIYSQAKRNGWSENPFVIAEEKGRQEAGRYLKWYHAEQQIQGPGGTRLRRYYPRR